MNKMQYDKHLKSLIREANAVRFDFQSGMYGTYFNAVRKISQFRKGTSMSNDLEQCEPCEGKGKKKDSTGFYPFTCAYCGGTGVREALTNAEKTVTVQVHTTPLSR